MKIVKIQGGLGNQMLQYAFAYKLKHLYPSEKILIDLTDFKGYDWHGYELDYVFGVKIPVANPFQILRFKLPVSSNSKYGKIILGRFGRFFQKDIYTEERKNYFAFTKEPPSKKA